MAQTRFPARFGKYILLDRLNSGGMAEVYRAKVSGAAELHRLVAIKCMLPAFVDDEHFVNMFIDEAKTAAQLGHPNIVQIYELGRIDGRLFISMELINGRDLLSIIERMRAAGVRAPASFAAYVVAKAAEGLDFAHRKVGLDGSPLNLVHRDVSPQNILVSFDGEVKVVDFGIAKAQVRGTETCAGMLEGKFAYMAPEQAMGHQVDRRVDIFTLGALLYELLTGRRAFQAEGDFSTLEKVKEAKVPSLAGVVPDFPPEIDVILSRAMAKDPAGRYAYASDLVEALAPLLIEERSIFGAKQAKELMQTLYAEDIELLREQLTRYEKIEEGDCVGASERLRAAGESEPFGTTLDTQVAGDGGDEASPTQLTARNTDDGAQTSAGSRRVLDAVTLGEAKPAYGPLLDEDSPSTSALGIRSGASRFGDGLFTPLFNGLVAASAALLAAVIGVVLLARYNSASPTQTVVTQIPPAIQVAGASASPRAELGSPLRAGVRVGSGMEPDGAPGPTASPKRTNDSEPAGRPTALARGKNPKKRGRPGKPARVGHVTIQVRGADDATVEVDGKPVGVAPLVRHKLRVGAHRIRVTGGDGRKTKVLDILVGPGGRKNPEKLTVDLSR